MPQYKIEITDRQSTPLVDHAFLEGVIRQVLIDESVDAATISLALVSDAEIHQVNRRFLGHDYPTDVISFLLNESAETVEGEEICPDQGSSAGLSTATSSKIPICLEGELIVSTETAIREATAHGWSPVAELLLYVVHGLLHLCGYDDLTDEARPLMRSRERELLALWGFCPTGLES